MAPTFEFLTRIPRAVYVAALSLTVLAPASAQLRIIRSGQASAALGGDPAPIGGFDLQAHCLATSTGGTAHAFSSPSFMNVCGSTARPYVIQRYPAWAISTLPSDSRARWVHSEVQASTPRTVLYCYEFQNSVSGAAGGCFRMHWATDDRLGDPANGANVTGVFLNGHPLPIQGGTHSTESSVELDLAPSQLVIGTNRVVIYARDTQNVAAGLIFSILVKPYPLSRSWPANNVVRVGPATPPVSGDFNGQFIYTGDCEDTGTLATTSPEQQGSGMQNDVWVKWTPIASGMTSFTCCPIDGFDSALALWEEAPNGTLIPLGWNDDGGTCGPLSSRLEANVDVGVTYHIQFGSPPSSTPTWGDATLTIEGPVGIGTNYCQPNPNSTGQYGVMSAAGSAVVADNNLALTASDLPTQSFGFFLTGQTQGLIPNPGGSEGNLCILGSIGRFIGPGQIQLSDSLGSFTLGIDLTQLPQPAGYVAAMSGESWNFQAWHRDMNPGGQTSNFTDGLQIVFL